MIYDCVRIFDRKHFQFYCTLMCRTKFRINFNWRWTRVSHTLNTHIAGTKKSGEIKIKIIHISHTWYTFFPIIQNYLGQISKNLYDFCVIINFQRVFCCSSLTFIPFGWKNCELISLLSVVYILIDQFISKKKIIYELMWSDAIKSTRQKGEQKRARACQSMRKRKKNGEKDRKGKRVHKRNLPLHVKILKTVSKYLNSFCSSWIIVY